MRLGITYKPKTESPEEWAAEMAAHHVKAVAMPCDYKTDINLIDRYVAAAKANDIMIAEVGAWSNPMSVDPEKAGSAFERCVESLKLADYVGAPCCVNITGADGLIWDAWYPGNYDPAFYKRMVETTQKIIAAAAPKRAVYTVEPMPWMVPESPEEYLKLIEDVGEEHMGVHLDMVNWINSFDRFRHQRELMDHTFELLHGRICAAHFKDSYLKHELTFEIRECPIGEGMFDIDYYVKKINEEDPNMPLMIEHLPEKADFLRSMDYVQQRYYG